MRKQMFVSLTIAVVFQCFCFFLWWLAGNEFKRSIEMAFFTGSSVAISAVIFLLSMACLIFDD